MKIASGDGEMGSRSGDFAWLKAEDGRPKGQQSISDQPFEEESIAGRGETSSAITPLTLTPNRGAIIFFSADVGILSQPA